MNGNQDPQKNSEQFLYTVTSMCHAVKRNICETFWTDEPSVAAEPSPTQSKHGVRTRCQKKRALKNDLKPLDPEQRRLLWLQMNRTRRSA